MQLEWCMDPFCCAERVFFSLLVGFFGLHAEWNACEAFFAVS
jgi:hypothetical protein